MCVCRSRLFETGRAVNSVHNLKGLHGYFENIFKSLVKPLSVKVALIALFGVYGKSGGLLKNALPLHRRRPQPVAII